MRLLKATITVDLHREITMKTAYVPPLILRQIIAWVVFRLGGLYAIVGMDVAYWWVYYTTPMDPIGDISPAVSSAIIAVIFAAITITSTVMLSRMYWYEMLPFAKQIIAWDLNEKQSSGNKES